MVGLNEFISIPEAARYRIKLKRKVFFEHLGLMLIAIAIGIVVIFLIDGTLAFCLNVAVFMTFQLWGMAKYERVREFERSGAFDCLECGRGMLKGFFDMKSLARRCKQCGFDPWKTS